MDVDLGQASGLDAAREIDGTDAGGRPHIILISARHEQDLAKLVETCPAIAFLSKLDLSGAAVNEILATAGPRSSGPGTSDLATEAGP
ncbi:hypothetical protein [Microbispora sp. H10670]|uniref:hypothetical protein n=1 Tax=Microbispora sp. H10670 TaxID=2729108 RepID=UPI001603296C|nr:hypothetical protein [Microbispora sp. H10670]